jgi:uncharacterized protein YdhG (YjbR/CyaY superfamily)
MTYLGYQKSLSKLGTALLKVSREVFRNRAMPKIAKDVDAYLASVPEVSRSKLIELRHVIRKTLPEQAQEVISYNMPYYKYHGPVVGFAAYKDHISLFGAIPNNLENEIKAYKTGRGSIQFPLDKPLPKELIRKIVRARIDRNKRRKKEA